MRRGFVVPLVLLVATSSVAGAQEATATVDPGMTKAQVIERLGPPAAERSRGSYTYLFYQNGCERTCGMSDLVTLESDTVVDAIFRASYRHYAGVSSSPTPRRPEVARTGSAPLAIPANRASGAASAGMAEEFASLLGTEPSAATAPAGAEPVARPAASTTQPASVSRDIAELLGNPAPPAGAEPAASAPAPAATAAKPDSRSALSPEVADLLGVPQPAPTEAPAPKPAAGKTAAKPALSPEVADLLGLPAPAGAPAADSASARPVSASPASPVLSPEVAALLQDPAADTAKSAAASAETPVQDLPRADTIKASGRAKTVNTWPPPRDGQVAEPTASRGDSTRTEQKPAQQPRATWPPPRDSSATRPAEPAPKPAADSTKKQDQPRGRTWTSWPPPAE